MVIRKFLRGALNAMESHESAIDFKCARRELRGKYFSLMRRQKLQKSQMCYKMNYEL